MQTHGTGKPDRLPRQIGKAEASKSVHQARWLIYPTLFLATTFLLLSHYSRVVEPATGEDMVNIVRR